MPPSRRAVRLRGLLVWPMAMIAAIALISQGSYSAFTAKTSNAGSSFGAGSVVLTDDDNQSALMVFSGLRPGSSASRCIAVTSSGTLPSSVKLYAADVVSTKNLAAYISLVITQGTGATYGSCGGFTALTTNAAVYSGTLDTFTNTCTSYATGAGVWSPTATASETRSYLVTYTLSTSTPDAAQGGTAGVTLVWETQST